MVKAKQVRKIAVENAAKRPSTPRKPARGRGLLRYDALVDATEFLLQSEDPDEVGLYRIAEQAGVPPASVYHFFPTKEAAFTALAMRIIDQLLKAHHEPIRARDINSWQDLFRMDCLRGKNFYNSHPAGLKIFYGGYGGVDARRIDEATSSRMAHASYARLDTIFHMPFMRNPEFRFACRMAMLDAIWSVSVQHHGYITDEFHEEAMVACLAYSRTFFPERLELRDEFRALVESDGMVSIPYDDFLPDAQARPAEPE